MMGVIMIVMMIMVMMPIIIMVVVIMAMHMVMIILVIGPLIGFTTAKLRYLIQNNTRLVLQALVALRPQSDSVSPRPEDR